MEFTQEMIDQFFFNDQYDDRIVKNALFKNRNKNFYKCKDAQRRFNDYLYTQIKFSNFRVDENANNLLGIPKNSLTYYMDYPSNSIYLDSANIKADNGTNEYFNQVNENSELIPYYNKKLFLEKYGLYHPISIIDTIKDHRVFRHMIFCYLFDKPFFGLQMAETSNGCYFIIEIDPNKGISQEKIDELDPNRESTVHLFYQIQSEVRYLYRAKYLIFGDNKDSDYYYIDFDSFQTISKIDKPNMDTWYLYVSDSGPNKNLMCMIPCTLIEKDSKLVVKVPLITINQVLSKVATCNCYLVNQYHATNHYIFTVGENTENCYWFKSTESYSAATLVLHSKKNPIDKIRIFEYDDNTSNIGRPLFSSMLNIHGYDSDHLHQFELAGIPYENTYQILTRLAAGSKIYVETYEALNINTEYDYPYADVGKCIRSEEAKLITEYIHSLPTVLADYSFDTFRKHEDYPNLRSYWMDLLDEALLDNTDRHVDLAKTFFVANNKCIRKIYRQKDYPVIFSRSVMDTSKEIQDPSKLYKFSEPMMYLVIHISQDITPASMIWINGIRINTEYIFIDRKNVYIYFKRKWLTKKEDNVIELEVSLYDTTIKHKFEEDVTFYSIASNTVIPNSENLDRMSLRNIQLYDTRTSKFLSPDEIEYRYKLGQILISPPEGDETEYLFDPDDLDYFMTHQNEYFIDDKDIYYMVKKESVLYHCPSTAYKQLNMSNVFMRLKTQQRINQPLRITNTNNYRKIYLDDALRTATVQMLHFKEKPDPSRFRVFYGGKLLNSSEYTIEIPTKYDGSVIVSINNISTLDNNREVILEYLSIEEECYCDTILGSEEWMNSKYINVYAYPDSEFIMINKYSMDDLDHPEYPLFPECLKVYVNGYRIPYDQIIRIPSAENIFHIEGYHSGDHLTIFVNSHDDYNYGYKYSTPGSFSLYNTHYNDEDGKAKNYLISNYGSERFK